MYLAIWNIQIDEKKIWCFEIFLSPGFRKSKSIITPDLIILFGWNLVCKCFIPFRNWSNNHISWSCIIFWVIKKNPLKFFFTLKKKYKKTQKMSLKKKSTSLHVIPSNWHFSQLSNGISGYLASILEKLLELKKLHEMSLKKINTIVFS